MSDVSARKPAARMPPELIIVAACAISMLTFGPRAASGNFQMPVLADYGWGSDTFSFALAIQNLLWGMGQPFAGALADQVRLGARAVGRRSLVCGRPRADGDLRHAGHCSR